MPAAWYSNLSIKKILFSQINPRARPRVVRTCYFLPSKLVFKALASDYSAGSLLLAYTHLASRPRLLLVAVDLLIPVSLRSPEANHYCHELDYHCIEYARASYIFLLITNRGATLLTSGHISTADIPILNESASQIRTRAVRTRLVWFQLALGTSFRPRLNVSVYRAGPHFAH